MAEVRALTPGYAGPRGVRSIPGRVERGPQPAPRKGGPDRSLAIQLSGGDVDALNALARKHGVSVNSLLRELVGNFLKYR